MARRHEVEPMEKILIVDDEAFICENLQRILGEEHYDTTVAQSGEAALESLRRNHVDLVFLDLSLPDMHGLDILKHIKGVDPDLLVIVITGYASVESAVEALKMGAYDYIKKPFKADVIKLIVRLALETQSLKREVSSLRKQQEGLLADQPLIAESSAFKDILRQVREIARHADATVLITGETGTGKDLIARTIHTLSPRASRPFLEINCAALPENLLESELFGHESGAFTGARGRKLGLFEAASRGTILLDELGEMDLPLQAKLLRVIEDKKVRRIGGTQTVEVDVRIIAATNVDLQEAIKARRFREDLYYRLHAIPIHLPPIRERPEDVVALAKTFLSEYSRKYGRRFRGISPEAHRRLLSYGWPGNVRELRHVIERICILHDGELILELHLPKELTDPRESDLKELFPVDFVIPPEGINLEQVVDQFTHALIEGVMKMVNGNISHAAKLLGIPRGTLRYKIEKFQMESTLGLTK
ncbi:MAG: sigma-54 dependent transcriptional regulator [Syntrophobacteraceae bacterium]|nr:sigma-54 dependent transcriptional regulator [Syntrophobacteraceae bacterium]